MVTKRIIPCLDIRNGRVVKGVNFKGVQDVEDPVALARRYNDAGAEYGVTVPGAVARGNVYGCQFHPEKSGEAGLRILRAFAAL